MLAILAILAVLGAFLSGAAVAFDNGKLLLAMFAVAAVVAVIVLAGGAN